MKIISSFKDYYDNCQGYGFDPKLIYIRKTEHIVISPDSELMKIFSGIRKKISLMPYISSPIISRGLVGFCGKLYPFWEYNGIFYYDPNKMQRALIDFTSSSDHNDRVDARKALRILNKERRLYTPWDIEEFTIEGLTKFLHSLNRKIDDTVHIHIKAPSFVIQLQLGALTLIVNPNLKEYNFPTQVDPYTAYQEISMYLGNNLAEQMDPLVKISDKLKAESKGFDKWSFRKHKDDNKKHR
jgi:hypothetical protein